MRNPFELTDADGYQWLRGNLHCHTTNSDGALSPQERVDGYAAAGYDFLCVSDHDRITRPDSVRPPAGLVLIPGAELHPDNPFGGEKHHFLCLNITRDMDARSMPPQHVLDAVREQSGSPWLAHPHWSNINVLRDVMPLSGLAGVEVFNTVCHRTGRGEGSVHWDDWMSQLGHPLPAMANDDAHGKPHNGVDTYQGWTMVRARERTPDAIVEALEAGLTYSTTGPQIHELVLKRIAKAPSKGRGLEITVRCSEAQRIAAISDTKGTDYWREGETFTEATWHLKDDARWIRVEVVDPTGRKAWTNPLPVPGAE